MTEPPKEIREKPQTEGEFERPVAWLLGRQLIANLKYIALYAAFKGKLDARDWMSTRVYSFTGTATREPAEIDIEPINFTSHTEDGEFWFDYLADSGDGQMALYSLAYLFMSDLWVDAPTDWEDGTPRQTRELIDEEKAAVKFVENDEHRAKLRELKRTVLPRGAFLFVGGDTSYHISDYATLAERFQAPFWWAYRDLHKKGRAEAEAGHRHPIFGIPGNHDYYDALDGFNRQFRRPSTGEDVAPDERQPLLCLPTFMRCQEASYIALQLPHDWWFWGFDTENGDMDFRQRKFFQRLKEKTNPRKLIVATSQPTTVFGKYADPHSPLVEEFKALKLQRPFLKRRAGKFTPGSCRLDLSGDVHHYARYWGPDAGHGHAKRPSADNYASVVAGIGGAFMHPSQTDVGEVEEQALFPAKEKSRRAVGDEILKFWNLMTGGYVWLLGFILAFIVYFGATVPQSSRQVVACFPLFDKVMGVTCGKIEPTVQLLPTPQPTPQVQSYFWGADADTRPEGYFYWVSALLFSILAITGAVIYSSGMFKESSKEKGQNKLSLLDIAVSKKFWPFWILLAFAALGLCYGMYNFMFTIEGSRITPFGCSMLVLVSLVWGACAVVESFLYSGWLFNQAYSRRVHWYDYWPVWGLVGFAVAASGSSLWYFGRYNRVPYLISDITFALTALTVLLGLVGFAISTGGKLQKAGGKVLFGFFGFWHAVLQLSVPFLLVVRGSWASFAVTAVSVFVFMALGTWLVKRHAYWLALVWMVYGAWLLYVPFLLPSDQALLPSVSNYLTSHVSSLNFPQFPAMLSCLAAGLVGLLMTCVTFGWYLATCLAFNGHNNEAGGAARIEGFKGFIRIRLTADELTAYVVGFDKPEIDGDKLKVKIIDTFKLKSAPGGTAGR
ncbi:MAG: hypothetical protein JOZ96_17180 [Acidobacteria bacterium]|nr:hypothetical protein [Acidobacteriota bacterium]